MRDKINLRPCRCLLAEPTDNRPHPGTWIFPSHDSHSRKRKPEGPRTGTTTITSSPRFGKYPQPASPTKNPAPITPSPPSRPPRLPYRPLSTSTRPRPAAPKGARLNQPPSEEKKKTRRLIAAGSLCASFNSSKPSPAQAKPAAVRSSRGVYAKSDQPLLMRLGFSPASSIASRIRRPMALRISRRRRSEGFS